MNRKSFNAGSSMAEVIVGFALFVILMASFYGVFKLSNNMIMYSEDKLIIRQSFEKEFYKTEAINKAINHTSDFFDAEKLEDAISFYECDSNGNKLSNGTELILNNALYKIYDKDGQYGIPVYVFEKEK